MASQPNIVFFFTDDQRFDTIRALGNDEIITPNIDRLVREGTSFTHAHIPCGTSGAVCMPSRAMLHTGRPLFHIEREGQSIPPAHTTLGEALRAAGYRTFGTGKWHNGTAAYARSFTDGAEIMFGGMDDHWNVQACDFDLSGEYRPNPMIKDAFHSNAVTHRHCDHITCGKHSSELFAEAAIDFVEGTTGEQPFFLYLSFMAPHDPRSMPKEFLEQYDPTTLTLPNNFRGEHAFDFGILKIRDEVLAPYPRTEKDTRQQIAEYYAMITHLDHQIGRVMKALEAKGEYENTLFVFAGDNGLAVGQHGLFGKQSCYEHSVRVPLIFAGPGVPSGLHSDAYCYLFDIFPTLCDLVDIRKPASVEGQSLRPVIDGTTNAHRDSLYFAYTDNIRAVKDRRWKLVEYVGTDAVPCRKTQLFDLENDPLEVEDLSEVAARAGEKARLQQELLRLRNGWDDMTHPMGRRFWSKCELGD